MKPEEGGKMRLIHTHYIFMTLILFAVLLLCILLHMSLMHPVRRHIPLDNITPDLKQLLHQSSAQVLKNRKSDNHVDDFTPSASSSSPSFNRKNYVNETVSHLAMLELSHDIEISVKPKGTEIETSLTLSQEQIVSDKSSNWDLQRSGNAHCTPQKNIVFLKTHKCATSTVQNIIFRHGEKHQLRFVLPKSERDHRFSLKKPFNRIEVLTEEDDTESFNIFANHAIFNQREIEAIMPVESIYISILRDPVSMYESIFAYMRLDLRFSPDEGKHLVSMEEFLDSAPHFYQNWKEVYSGQYSRNPMLYDFGLRPELMDNKTEINALISMLDKRFDLIMIADYFEESLIMLKHLLCLELGDIAYLTFNVRSEDSVRDINTSLSKKIRAWNWGDVLLYNHFNKTFHEKLKLFDQEKMKMEITELRKLNTRLKETCVSDVAVDMESIWHPEGIQIEGFRLKKDQQDESGFCKKVTRAEKVYTDILKLRQLLY